MANITNAQVVAWANNRARTLSDATEIFLAKILAYQSDYIAEGIAAAITGDPAGAAAKIDDGSVPAGAFPGQPAMGDGRQSITGTSLANLKAAIDQIVTAMNVTLVPGVGLTVKAIVDGIQVNGSPR
jgi:hypothetical protein